MKKVLKRYRLFLVVTFAILAILLFNFEFGIESLKVSGNSLLFMLTVIPPIFILLGLLDVWVPRETMVKYMGKDSGLKGILIALFIGSATAGPLYGAFPVAAVFLRKGASMRNVMVFIGAWSTTKIPMFLFEFASLGVRFAVTRLLVDIPGIIIIAMLLTRMVPKEEQERIIEKFGTD